MGRSDNLNKKVEEMFDDYMMDKRTELDAHICQCESPIEEIFATVYYIENETNSGSIRDAITHILKLEGGLVLDNQVKVGKYRVDFLFKIIEFGQKKPFCQYVVECDGHEFHEKTKEQVEKRNRRDRFLESKGYTVIHLSGSEIYNNPQQALYDVLNTIIMREANRMGQESNVLPFEIRR